MKSELQLPGENQKEERHGSVPIMSGKKSSICFIKLSLFFISVRKSTAQPEPEESDRPPKRPRKIEATPNTSVESDLRQESLKSLLTLIRTDNEDPNRSAEAKDKPNGTEVRSTAQEIVPNGNLTQPPPIVNQICEICMHRRARVS